LVTNFILKDYQFATLKDSSIQYNTQDISNKSQTIEQKIENIWTEIFKNILNFDQYWVFLNVNTELNMDNIRYVLSHLKISIPKLAAQGGGHILIIPDTSQINSNPDEYMSTLHSLLGLVRSFAVESIKLNVRVNIANPFSILDYASEHYKKEWERLIFFLMSEDSQIINGSEHHIELLK